MKKQKPIEEASIDEIDIDEEDYEDGDVIPETEEITTDYSDVSYEDFSKACEMTPEEEIEDSPAEEVEESDDSNSVTHKSSTEEYYADDNEGWITILSFFWTWYRRLGIVIAIILIAYFIVKGMFAELGLYILLLVAAYFFGYGFMAVLTKFTESH